MGRIERFEDLQIWQEARVVANSIYKTFADKKDYGFRDQIQRASVSVMNNIAEGFERGSENELIRYLYIAKASSGEVRSMLYLATDLNYIDEGNAEGLMDQSKKVSSGIANFIKYLKSKK